MASDKFAEREDANRRLTALARFAHTELERASRSTDAEVARRAGAILARVDQREVAHLAVLREVTRRKTPGAVPVLLDAPRVWERPRLREVAEEVLAAANSYADLEALKRGMDLSNDHARVAVAQILLNRGDRQALPALGELLDSPHLMVRYRACRLLRLATGEEIGFAAYDPLGVRAKGAAEWRQWIKSNGLTARLTLPVQPSSGQGACSFHWPEDDRLLVNWKMAVCLPPTPGEGACFTAFFSPRFAGTPSPESR